MVSKPASSGTASDAGLVGRFVRVTLQAPFVFALAGISQKCESRRTPMLSGFERLSRVTKQGRDYTTRPFDAARAGVRAGAPSRASCVRACGAGEIGARRHALLQVVGGQGQAGRGRPGSPRRSACGAPSVAGRPGNARRAAAVPAAPARCASASSRARLPRGASVMWRGSAWCRASCPIFVVGILIPFPSFVVRSSRLSR